MCQSLSVECQTTSMTETDDGYPKYSEVNTPEGKRFVWERCVGKIIQCSLFGMIVKGPAYASDTVSEVFGTLSPLRQNLNCLVEYSDSSDEYVPPSVVDDSVSTSACFNLIDRQTVLHGGTENRSSSCSNIACGRIDCAASCSNTVKCTRYTIDACSIMAYEIAMEETNNISDMPMHTRDPSPCKQIVASSITKRTQYRNKQVIGTERYLL
jgi:hypothetical protein